MATAAATAADVASRIAARPVNAVTGGQGGTVMLIAGILFLGYLFLTRRLQAVARALQQPVDPAAPSTAPVSPGELTRRARGPIPAGGSVGDVLRERYERTGEREWPGEVRPEWSDPAGRPYPGGRLPRGRFIQ